MRLIKIVFIFIIVVIGLYLVACLFIPAKFTVERSLTVESPGDIVFEKVGYFKNWDKWNPWKAKDSKLKTLFGPNDGKTGSYWLWKSDKSGEGRMTSTEIKDQQLLAYHVSFEKPYKAEADGHIKIEPEGVKTKITWMIEGTNPFHLRVLNLLMDKWIGPEFEKGLQLLKVVTEQEATVLNKVYYGYRIKETRFEGARIAYVKKSIPFEEVDEFFRENYIKIKEEAQNCKFTIDGNNLALFYGRDEINSVSSIAAAVQVMGDSALGEDYSLMQIQPKKALLLNYYGGYKSSQNAYRALDNYLKNKRLRLKKPVIEEYVTGPKQQRDSNQWHTRIWYLIE